MLFNFNVRTYFRNKKILNAMGMTHSWQQHKQFTHKMLAQGKEPISVVGAIMKNNLTTPVTVKNCDTYTIAKDGKNQTRNQREMISVNRSRAYRQADDYTKEHIGLAERAVHALSDVHHTPLLLNHSQNVKHITVGERDDVEEKTHIINQKFTLVGNGALRYALVA